MSRYRAAAYHALISAVVLLSTLLFTLLVWYRPPLAQATGAMTVMMIMAGVDVVLGPLVTLIVFNPAKKSLRFDMACVVSVQLAFLLYGVSGLYSGRPAYVVFAENRFVLTCANDIDPKDLSQATREEFRQIPKLGAHYVATRQPEDLKTRNDLVFASLGGMGIQNLPKYFVPYSSGSADVIRASKSIDQVPQDDLLKPLIKEAILRHPSVKLRFVPLLTKMQRRYIAINSADGAVVEVI